MTIIALPVIFIKSLKEIPTDKLKVCWQSKLILVIYAITTQASSKHFRREQQYEECEKSFHNYHLVFFLNSLYTNRGHEGPKFVASNSLVPSFPTSNKSFFIMIILPRPTIKAYTIVITTCLACSTTT